MALFPVWVSEPYQYSLVTPDELFRTHLLVSLCREQLDDHFAHLAHARCAQHTRQFGDVRDITRLSLFKDVDVVSGHTFLSDQDLFGSVDDEITAHVHGTFADPLLLLRTHSRRQTEVTPDHDGYLRK